MHLLSCCLGFLLYFPWIRNKYLWELQIYFLPYLLHRNTFFYEMSVTPFNFPYDFPSIKFKHLLFPVEFNFLYMKFHVFSTFRMSFHSQPWNKRLQNSLSRSVLHKCASISLALSFRFQMISYIIQMYHSHVIQLRNKLPSYTHSLQISNKQNLVYS